MLKPAGAVSEEGLCHFYTAPDALPEASTAKHGTDAVTLRLVAAQHLCQEHCLPLVHARMGKIA